MDMATFSTWRNTTERVVWHDETIQTTTFEVVDDATGEWYRYSKVTATVTTEQVARIVPTGQSAQMPPPSMAIPSYDRTSTTEGTNRMSGDDQKTTKPKKYSSKSWGPFGLRG